jgi:hypothetical protein
MQNAAGDGVAQASHDPNDAYRAVVSDLISLVEHVQSSLRLIERTIARDTAPGSPESSTGVIVLDDVSPRYMKAAAASSTFPTTRRRTAAGFRPTRISPSGRRTRPGSRIWRFTTSLPAFRTARRSTSASQAFCRSRPAIPPLPCCASTSTSSRKSTTSMATRPATGS